jgi:hypothetical protein
MLQMVLSGQPAQSSSAFHANAELLCLFGLTQFQTEGYGEVAEPDRFTFSWNCSSGR